MHLLVQRDCNHSKATERIIRNGLFIFRKSSQSVRNEKLKLKSAFSLQNISNQPPGHTAAYFGIQQTNHYQHTLISSCYTDAVEICHTFKGSTKFSISILILIAILVEFKVFWGAMPRHSITAYQQLGQSCCLRLVP